MSRRASLDLRGGFWTTQQCSWRGYMTGTKHSSLHSTAQLVARPPLHGLLVDAFDHTDLLATRKGNPVAGQTVPVATVRSSANQLDREFRMATRPPLRLGLTR